MQTTDAVKRRRERSKRWRLAHKEELAAKRKWRYDNDPEFREKMRKASRDSGRKNIAKKLEYNRKWNALHRDRKNHSHLRVTYGLSPEQHETIFNKQNRRCPICGTDSPKSKINPWHVDHCHETGRIRGILCHRCNNGLGSFDDNSSKLGSAILYLECAE